MSMPVLIEVSDPEGTYCCHPTPKQLREWTATYYAREMNLPKIDGNYGMKTRGGWKHYRQIDGVEVELVTPKFPTPAKYPSLVEDDSEVEVVDTDDTWTRIAYNRYRSLMRKAAKVKHKSDSQRRRVVTRWVKRALELDGEAREDALAKTRNLNTALLRKRDEQLQRLRWEWAEVERETEVTWEDASSHLVLTNEEAEKLLKRERYEVRYAHRDPSDWQARAVIPEPVRDRVAVQAKLAEMDGVTFTEEAKEEIVYVETLAYRIAEFDAAYKRFYRELGEDWMHGRIVTRWHYDKASKRSFPLTSVSKDEYVQRKIEAKGDVLAGYESAISGLRYRLERKRERDSKRKGG